MNFSSRSLAVTMAVAATFTAAPQQAKAELPQASQDVLEAIQFLRTACNENINIKKVIQMKASNLSRSLKAKCAYVDAASVTANCVVAAKGSYEQMAQSTANCIYLHGQHVISNTANTVQAATVFLKNSPAVKTLTKSGEQQWSAAQKDYNSAKSTVQSTITAANNTANSVEKGATHDANTVTHVATHDYNSVKNDLESLF
jgi:hypothetical protein